MNGELYQLCRIVAAAKSTMANVLPFQMPQLDYERRITFDFLPRR
jgi:hypothetical protein